MAVPEAQITRLFFADERIVLFRAGAARPRQPDHHRPRINRRKPLVGANRLTEDLAQFGPYRATIPPGTLAQALFGFLIEVMDG
jgi:hypothetical protein